MGYHVVGANIPSAAVATGDVDTLNGESISIVATADGVRINDVANVINVDNLANNGIVHIIDAVLLPPSPTPPTPPAPPLTSPPTRHPTRHPHPGKTGKKTKSSKPKAGKKSYHRGRANGKK